MVSYWFIVVLEVSIITCGLVAGVFLTFSDFVMRSLGLAKPAAGIEVMQIINRQVFATIFMVLLLGWSAMSPLMIGYAYFNIAGHASVLIIAGGGVYLAGVFIVSMVFNVPMNQRLDALEFSSTDADTYWRQTFLPRWTFWNYVRAVSATISAICFLIAVKVLT